MLDQFFESLREGKNGFSFDEPVRIDEKSLVVVVPILRKTSHKRTYVLLSEVSDVKIEDTGQIDYVRVTNTADKPLFITRGEIFRGKTQERAAIHGYIIPAGRSCNVAVRCIHKSKGISVSATMTYGGKVPYSIDLSNQHSTWDSVAAYCCSTPSYGGDVDYVRYDNGNPLITSSINYSSSDAAFPFTSNVNWWGGCNTIREDDLVSNLDNLKDKVKGIMSKIPKNDQHIGFITLNRNEVTSIELYDHPDSWSAIYEDTLFKEGSLFAEKSEDIDFFVLNTSKIKSFLKNKLPKEVKTKTVYDKEYSVLEVSDGDLKGEAVTYKNRVVHLQMSK